jgi:hypothetical protein
MFTLMVRLDVDIQAIGNELVPIPNQSSIGNGYNIKSTNSCLDVYFTDSRIHPSSSPPLCHLVTLHPIPIVEEDAGEEGDADEGD